MQEAKDMKIAFITPEYITEENFDGGLANYLARVASALVGLGHEVTVIVRSTIDDTLICNGVRVSRVRISGPPLFFLNSLLRDVRAPLDWVWQSWKINRAFQGMHRREQFDVVQYASYTAPGLFRSKGITSVVRLSSYEPLMRKASDLDLSFSRRLQALLEQIALKRADGLFCPSSLIAQIATQQVGRSVDVIESPFVTPDLLLDHQPYQDLLSGKSYLLFFGSISVLKGVGTIAAIIRALLEAHSELHFVFIGKDLGCKGRPMMEQVWEQAGSYRGRVHYLGKMRHAQLLPIVQHSRGVVLPSRVDNLPNTCIESMALGKVVIGTCGTSFEQLIEDNISGFLCPPDEPVALLAAIDKLLKSDSARLEEIGRNARARIEILSGSKVLEDLVDFYQWCRQGRL
jgi:glycogen(starch) synthase